MNEQNASQEDDGDQRIHRPIIRERQVPEQGAAGNALDAVLAARETCRLHRRKIDDLREGEGDHREIDVLPPDRQPAEGGTKQGAGQAAGDDAELGREADRLHEVAGDIAAEAEIRGLAEGE